MRITKKHIVDIIENNKNDTTDNVVGSIALVALSVFFLSSFFGMIGSFVIDNPTEAIGTMFGMTLIGSLVVTLVALVTSFRMESFKKRTKKLQNKVLQDNNINTTIDDIEKMSDEQLNELCHEPLFSMYCPLSDEEIVAFNDDVKKYGTRAQIGDWTEYLHQVRETPLGRVRQYMTSNLKTQLDEQKKHTDTPLKILLDDLLVDDIQARETDELIVSQKHRSE